MHFDVCLGFCKHSRRSRRSKSYGLASAPPQAWLNKHLEEIRHTGMVMREKLRIDAGKIGPLAPVLHNGAQFLYFCAGRSVEYIEKLDDFPIPRLQEWTKHHYPNGRTNCLVGRENFDSNDQRRLGEKMDEWHANFPVHTAPA